MSVKRSACLSSTRRESRYPAYGPVSDVANTVTNVLKRVNFMTQRREVSQNVVYYVANRRLSR